MIRDHTFSSEQAALAKKSVSDLFARDPADRAVAAKRFRNSEIPIELILRRLKLAELQSEALRFAAPLLFGVPLIPVVLFMRERYPATYFYAVFISHALLVLALAWPVSKRLDRARRSALEALFLTPGGRSLNLLAQRILEQKGAWREPARLLALRVAGRAEELTVESQKAMATFAGRCVSPLGGTLLPGAEQAASAFMEALGDRGSWEHSEELVKAVERGRRSSSGLLFDKAEAAVSRIKARSGLM